MKPQKRNEDAASPVIGVMLMLVVTVVIAAVITAFATGMAGDSTSTTPMALFEAENQNVGQVTINGDSYTVIKSFDLVHKGGDEVSAENIQIVIEPEGQDFGYGIQLVRKLNDVTNFGGDSLTTGERIRITLNYNTTDERVVDGDLVKWTLSDTRTTGVIAKGEFVVPEK